MSEPTPEVSTVVEKVTCSVCFEDIPQILNYYPVQDSGSSCGHQFHFHCLMKWISKKPNNGNVSSNTNTCPNCRREVSGLHTDGGYSFYRVEQVTVEADGGSIKRFQLIALDPLKDIRLHVYHSVNVKKMDNVWLSQQMAHNILRKKARITAAKARATRKRNLEEARRRELEEREQIQATRAQQIYGRDARRVLRSRRKEQPEAAAPGMSASGTKTCRSTVVESSSDETDSDSDDDENLFIRMVTMRPKPNRSRRKSTATTTSHHDESGAEMQEIGGNVETMQVPATATDSEAHVEPSSVVENPISGASDSQPRFIPPATADLSEKTAGTLAVLENPVSSTKESQPELLRGTVLETSVPVENLVSSTSDSDFHSYGEPNTEQVNSFFSSTKRETLAIVENPVSSTSEFQPLSSSLDTMEIPADCDAPVENLISSTSDSHPHSYAEPEAEQVKSVLCTLTPEHSEFDTTVDHSVFVENPIPSTSESQPAPIEVLTETTDTDAPLKTTLMVEKSIPSILESQSHSYEEPETEQGASCLPTTTPPHTFPPPPPPIKFNSKSRRPYACSRCPKRFTSNSNRTSHENTHSKNYVRPVCADCGKSFSRKSVLKTHRKTFHDN